MSTEMIVANAIIHFEAFLKQFYTFRSRDISGGCSHMTIQSDSWCTITSENGLRKVELSICQTNLCERSEKNGINRKAHQWGTGRPECQMG